MNPVDFIALHIPDGFISGPVLIVLWLACVAAVAFALRHGQDELGERQVPLMGVMAAAIFAGQMLNFPVAGGTSGHLMGAALATILLGPWAAVLVMTSVVSVQALLFQDGGLVALGANLFNMAVVGVAVSYFVHRTVLWIAGRKPAALLAGGFLSGFLSILVTSLAVALQLAVSGSSPADLAVPVMAGVHTLIGVGEGLITLGALAFVLATRRDLLKTGEAPQVGGKAVWAAGLAVALLLGALAPLASSDPDGLEKVAGQLGFAQRAQDAEYNIIPNYVVPGVDNAQLATILAAVIGMAVVLGVTLALAYARRRRAAARPPASRESKQPPPLTNV